MNEKYYYFHACYRNNTASLISDVCKVSASCRSDAMQKAFNEMIPYFANDISLEEICEAVYEAHQNGKMKCSYIKWSMTENPYC